MRASKKWERTRSVNVDTPQVCSELKQEHQLGCGGVGAVDLRIVSSSNLFGPASPLVIEDRRRRRT